VRHVGAPSKRVGSAHGWLGAEAPAGSVACVALIRFIPDSLKRIGAFFSETTTRPWGTGGDDGGRREGLEDLVEVEDLRPRLSIYYHKTFSS
jgi:hypothetical protein